MEDLFELLRVSRDFKDFKDRLHIEMIRHAETLTVSFEGNIAELARILKMNRTTLVEMVRKLGISVFGKKAYAPKKPYVKKRPSAYL